MELTLVESRARKCAFLREAVRTLGLLNVAVEQARFEDLASRASLEGSADVVSLRAVRADLPTWLLAAWILKPGGMVLWFHAPSQASAAEAADASTAGLEVLETRDTATGAALSVLTKPRRGRPGPHQ